MKIIETLKSNKVKKLKLITSFIITIIFTLFNAFIGLYKNSIWHISIALYYVILVLIRFVIVMIEKKIKAKENNNQEETRNIRKVVYIIISILLIILSLALIVPISLMATNQKEVNMGLIPALAVSCYTTYKITISIINYKKSNNSISILYKQLKTVNLIDAILSILTLQNTLILVNDGLNNDMVILTSITSLVGVLIIFTLSIHSFKFIKQKKAHE